jgi:predicted transcriptional regulator YdeE
MAKHFTPANFVEMSNLWKGVAALRGFKGQIGGETYGVRRKRYRDNGSFDFLAAVKVESGCKPPEPMQVLTLPPRTYLLYYQVADAPDFQLYPAKFKVKAGWVNDYLPIEL